MKIGFIGIGVMGTGIINNLRKNNYDVTVQKMLKIFILVRMVS